jgi:hypothetical protein
MTLKQRQNTARANISAWRNSNYTDLNSAYDRCSKDKRDAWEYCVDLCRRKNGTGLKVISRNSYRFTAGFEFDNPDTGELMFMYISPTYDQEVSLAITD